MWMSYELTQDVTRHEMGHNYGHPHHLANNYSWRFSRGGNEESGHDGWDMMSGGNHFAVSDLAAASKWWFNWIPDEAVIHMDPDGRIPGCPQCMNSLIQQVLHPFDKRDLLPSASNKMVRNKKICSARLILTMYLTHLFPYSHMQAVHIPIFAETDLEGQDRCYSIWLSYRSGNDGLANGGLSIHSSWFDVGGPFGATYDSLNYDAFGDTEDDTSDSFILPGTCYVVSPSLNVLDAGLPIAKAAMPVVCVDSIQEGQTITISVSFLDQANPPLNTAMIETQSTLTCGSPSTSGQASMDMSNGQNHLLHVMGTGSDGVVTLDMCLESSSGNTVKAYSYDS